MRLGLTNFSEYGQEFSSSDPKVSIFLREKQVDPLNHRRVFKQIPINVVF